jgi:hypothetical protein
MRPRGSGLCLARAIDGRDVLAHAGVRARIFLGGMLFRSSWGVHVSAIPTTSRAVEPTIVGSRPPAAT